MSFLSRHMLLILGLLLWIQKIEADQERPVVANPSIYVSNEIWEQVIEYLMPNDHPIKEKLDQIFLRSRALTDKKSMKAAGFAAAKPQHHSQIIVAKHPELKGYVIKAYRDDQDYHSGKPEQYFWIKRAQGARLIQESIVAHKYEHLFKVPKKWIYVLPDEPSPPSNYLRKIFILVEEDMELLDKKRNKKSWGSSVITKELLQALYTILTELGLFDCSKPSNCPFSIDGRVAFIDTQSYHKKRVKYHNLTPYLSSSRRSYWEKLIKN